MGQDEMQKNAWMNSTIPDFRSCNSCISRRWQMYMGTLCLSIFCYNIGCKRRGRPHIIQRDHDTLLANASRLQNQSTLVSTIVTQSMGTLPTATR